MWKVAVLSRLNIDPQLSYVATLAVMVLRAGAARGCNDNGLRTETLG